MRCLYIDQTITFTSTYILKPLQGFGVVFRYRKRSIIQNYKNTCNKDVILFVIPDN